MDDLDQIKRKNQPIEAQNIWEFLHLKVGLQQAGWKNTK